MSTVADLTIDYSIIVPVYFNEGSLSAITNSIMRDVVESNSDRSCEIIFVDDGSDDGSLDELLKIREINPEMITVIKFTRNFGQVYALQAGLSHARGKCVIAMSADGQDPPAMINQMLQAHFDDQFDVVLCARQGRDESYYRILTSKLFYRLIQILSFDNMPSGGFDFLLLSRRAVEVLLRNEEAHPFLQGQILWMGFKTKFIEYRRQERKVGRSRWTFAKKLTYLIDGSMSYSYLPIRLMSLLGIVSAVLGVLYAVVILAVRLVAGNPVQGWAPLMIVVLIMGGIQMLMLGIIGEYLWRTLAQARNRDPYIVDAIYEKADRFALDDKGSPDDNVAG